MDNDLIVIVFDNQQYAKKARGALEIMRNSPFLGAMNSLPFTRDSAGKVVVQIERLPLDQSEPDRFIPDQLANTIFFGSEDEIQQLVAAGLDEGFVQIINASLDPGHSLLLIYVRYDSLVDPQQVLEILKQFNGRLYQTTISPQLEEVLLNQVQRKTIE